MKIYLDVDDTLASFRKHAVARGVPDWEGSWYTTDPATWTDEQKLIQAETNRQMCMPDFWRDMPVAEGSFELIAAAASRGDVYLLTALPSFIATADVHEMVRREKLRYATERLHFPKAKTIICARSEKVQYAYSLSRCGEYLVQNVLVDDATQNCHEWVAANGIAIHHEVDNMKRSIESVKNLDYLYEH